MVAVINFGGQYAHLIARRIRELHLKSELFPPQIKVSQLKKINPDAIVLSGSPFSCYQKDAPKIDPRIYNLQIPILGICYGQQLMAVQLGGKVSSHSAKQFGREEVKIQKSALFKNLPAKLSVWFSHGDQVDKLPQDFKVIASTQNAQVAAMEESQKKLYGIQFHAEVSHTPAGMIILKNFLFKIAHAQKDWNLQNLKDELAKSLKKKIRKDRIVMAISGGVDSLVAATILKKAVPQNLYLVFVNTGLLRQYDLADFKNVVHIVGFKNIKIVNAQQKFLKTLRHVVDPEEKRKKIADLYFSILEEEAKKIGHGLPAGRQVKYLGQGTIYPDRIESAQTSKHADKIKSHHNVTLSHGLKLEIIEPLADFYKDEVRSLGKLLDLAPKFLNRHPFPGPGLAIRILGEVTKERLSILKKVDSIFIEELTVANIYNKVGQALAALLPVKSVGVMGDSRTYSYIIALRAVDTEDFMTADWSKIPNQILEKISSRIVNEVAGVNRVLFDITQKPPATIEYE